MHVTNGTFCFLISLSFRFRRERTHDRRDSKFGHVWIDWHYHGHWCLNVPRLVSHPGFAFSQFRIMKRLVSPTGQPVTQIFLDMVGEKGTFVFMVGVLLRKEWWYARDDDRAEQVIIDHHRGDVLLRVRSDQFSLIHKISLCSRLCRTFSVTSKSHMMRAFRCDGATRGSKFLHKVDRRWHSPIRTGSPLPFVFGVVVRVRESTDFVISVARVYIEFRLRFA
jgi:hypothetical protein